MIKKFYDAYKMMTSHEGTLFIYAFAYSLIVGIAPFLILAVVIAGNFFLDVDALAELISYYVPSDLIYPFINYIKHSAPSDLVLIISLASVSLWVASRSVYSFLLESSRVDAVRIRRLMLRVISLVYFLFIVFGVLWVVLLLNYLPPYNHITVPLLLWLLLMLFYRLLSFRFTRFSDVYMGSAFATAGIIVLGKIFFVYVNKYSNYQSIYGPMASLMIMLISGYFISWVVYGGFCINITFYDNTSSDDDVKRKLVMRLSNASLSTFLKKRKQKKEQI